MVSEVSLASASRQRSYEDSSVEKVLRAVREAGQPTTQAKG
jgi:hypothetical protein